VLVDHFAAPPQHGFGGLVVSPDMRLDREIPTRSWAADRDRYELEVC
jgi:hypothetical protein